MAIQATDTRETSKADTFIHQWLNVSGNHKKKATIHSSEPWLRKPFYS